MAKLWINNSLEDRIVMLDRTTETHKGMVRKMARMYIHEILSKELDEQLKATGVEGYVIENVTTKNINGELRPIDTDKDPTVIMVHYPSIVEENASYIPPRIKIEISCLSMDVPIEMRNVKSFIAETFPEEDSETEGMYKTVVPSRTFLEKIFLLAEEFQKEKPRCVRMSRHLYDLEKLMDTEYGRSALVDNELYDAIVNHRRIYYALKYVDYDRHNRKVISFLPPNGMLSEWRNDYDNMMSSFIYGNALNFDALMERMKELQRRINQTE